MIITESSQPHVVKSSGNFRGIKLIRDFFSKGTEHWLHGWKIGCKSRWKTSSLTCNCFIILTAFQSLQFLLIHHDTRLLWGPQKATLVGNCKNWVWHCGILATSLRFSLLFPFCTEFSTCDRFDWLTAIVLEDRWIPEWKWKFLCLDDGIHRWILCDFHLVVCWVSQQHFSPQPKKYLYDSQIRAKNDKPCAAQFARHRPKASQDKSLATHSGGLSLLLGEFMQENGVICQTGTFIGKQGIFLQYNWLRIAWAVCWCSRCCNTQIPMTQCIKNWPLKMYEENSTKPCQYTKFNFNIVNRHTIGQFEGFCDIFNRVWRRIWNQKEVQ